VSRRFGLVGGLAVVAILASTEGDYTHTHKHTHTHVYIHIYILKSMMACSQRHRLGFRVQGSGFSFRLKEDG
jgi:hypothetical protein